MNPMDDLISTRKNQNAPESEFETVKRSTILEGDMSKHWSSTLATVSKRQARTLPGRYLTY